MSRTRTYEKKKEYRDRLRVKEEEFRIKEAEAAEENEKKYWAIGAKDNSKEEAKEQKRLEKIAKRAFKKNLYEEEYQ